MNEAADSPHLKHALDLYHEVEGTVAETATLTKRLELTSLVLSVLTSGALWLLASEVLPKSTLWLGAIFSTATTFISLYLSSAGLDPARKRALALHAQVGQLIARLRSHDIDDNEFWRLFKNHEHELHEIRHGRNTP